MEDGSKGSSAAYFTKEESEVSEALKNQVLIIKSAQMKRNKNHPIYVWMPLSDEIIFVCTLAHTIFSHIALYKNTYSHLILHLLRFQLVYQDGLHRKDNRNHHISGQPIHCSMDNKLHRIESYISTAHYKSHTVHQHRFLSVTIFADSYNAGDVVLIYRLSPPPMNTLSYTISAKGELS